MDKQDDKVVRIPISYAQRKRNEFGNGYVPCEVSDRWLQFPTEVDSERYIPVDVMTQGANDKYKKICELILSKEDLLRALNAIQVKERE